MFSQKKVVLSTAIALSTAFTACASDAAHSGTCAAQIAQLEQQIQGSGPTAPQSIEAQLHHQPTPRTVQNAESLTALRSARPRTGDGPLVRTRERRDAACMISLTDNPLAIATDRVRLARVTQ